MCFKSHALPIELTRYCPHRDSNPGRKFRRLSCYPLHHGGCVGLEPTCLSVGDLANRCLIYPIGDLNTEYKLPFRVGAPGGARTHDLCLIRASLYQLSYRSYTLCGTRTRDPVIKSHMLYQLS